MIIESFDAIFYTAIFVLPGFIINSVIDATNPPKRHNDGIYLLKCLLYSIIHCAIWSWAYSVILNHTFKYLTLYWISLVLSTLTGATLIAICIVVIKQNNLIYKMFEKLKIRAIHSTPTAWDYIFSQQNSDYVIITLTDDTKIKGWFSMNSFASSDPEERDLYIEELYYEEDEQEWVKDKGSNGVYISKDQIKFIEFKKGENNEQYQKTNK